MKIGVLGPKGTFCYRACKNYLKELSESDVLYNAEIVYFPTIDEVFLNDECEYGIVPIENTLDGYVQRSLDLLLQKNAFVFDENVLPVQFSLIANVKEIESIEKLFVQFKANGQCRQFINSLTNASIIATESNMESFYKIDGVDKAAAIVPAHIASEELGNNTDRLVIENITDTKNNYTRFVVFRKNCDNNVKESFCEADSHRISAYIMPDSDRPGILFEILKTFHDKQINLISIMSRPTRLELGTYNFYVEIEGKNNNHQVIMEALEEIKKTNQLKVVGDCAMAK